MKYRNHLTSQGFTLAETLIVVVLVGLFATLMVPVISNYNEKKSYPALAKGAFTNLTAVTTEAMDRGKTNLLAHANNRLDTLRTCTDATAQGCWDTTLQGALGAFVANQGVVLRNGVVIIGLDSNITGDNRIGFQIDINGEKPPNQDGVDQLTFETCPTDAACALYPFDQYTLQGYPSIPGGLVPVTGPSRNLHGQISY